MKKVYLFVTMFLVVLLANGQKLPFQGKLIDLISGSPLNGTHSISVSIPDIGWSENHTVTVTDGLYFIVLGSTNPIPANIFSGVDERQMEISVNSNPLSAVTLYKPLSGDLSQLNVKGPGNGLIQGGFGTGSVVNENLPSLSMKGNLNESRLSLNVVGNSEGTSESAFINLNSTNGSLINLSPGWTTFSSTADGHAMSLANQGLYIAKDSKTYVQLVAQNWSNTGFSGYMNFNGPNSMNIQMGSKFWENSDLPWFNLNGSVNNRNLLALSGEKFDDNGTEKERGQFGVFDIDNYRTLINSRVIVLITPDHKHSVELNGHGKAGNFFLNGPNSENIYLGNKSWENSNLPYFVMKGTTNNVVAEISASSDENENGYFNLNSKNGNNTSLSAGTAMFTGQDDYKATFNSKEFLLRNPDWSHSAALVNVNGAGELELRGPGTRNFFIGSTSWENSNKPWFNMNGKDDQVKIVMTTIGDGNEERGIITITNNNGIDMTYANNGVWGSQRFGIYTGANIHNGLWVEGDIVATGTISAPTVIQTSDERLKKEIQPLSGTTLNKIESLGGYSYFWKKEEYPNKNFSADQQIGLLAQELEAQFPALVKTGDDGFKSVNYNGFTVVLLLAVKELNQKVEALEKENRLLKDEIVAATNSQKEMNELKSQIEALAKFVQIKIDSAGDTQSAENVSTNGLK